MNKYKIIAFCLASYLLLVAFQQNASPTKKKSMAASLKLTDKQIFGLKSLNAKKAIQIQKMKVFNHEDATIQEKINSLNERKIKLFFGDQLYNERNKYANDIGSKK